MDEGSFRKTRAPQLRNKRKDRVKILRIFWIITLSSVVLAYARPTASPPRGEAFWLVINVCSFPYEGKGDRNACVSVDEVESKTAEQRITRRDLELRVSHILVSVVAVVSETLREFAKSAGSGDAARFRTPSFAFLVFGRYSRRRNSKRICDDRRIR